MKHSLKKIITLAVCGLFLQANSLLALQTSAQLRIVCKVLPKPANLTIAVADLSSLNGKSMEDFENFASEKGLAFYSAAQGDNLLVRFTKTA